LALAGGGMLFLVGGLSFAILSSPNVSGKALCVTLPNLKYIAKIDVNEIDKWLEDIKTCKGNMS
jgi:hypothetical protein